MPSRNDIAAVVLAAGQSRRYGADKLLQPCTCNGLTLPLAAQALCNWLQVFDQVTVVVQPQATTLRAALAAALPSTALRWVEAPHAEQGMGHSLAAGVAANADAAGWLVGLADMPMLPAAVIAQVREALEAGVPLVAPYVGEKRGHPVGFAAHYRDELLALHGDSGARTILQRDAQHVMRLACDHAGIFADVDTPADLTRIEEKLQ